MDKLDTVTMDVPLFIRLLELAREDIKTDAQLHEVVTRALQVSKEKEVMTMDDYSTIEGKSMTIKALARIQVTASILDDLGSLVGKAKKLALGPNSKWSKGYTADVNSSLASVRASLTRSLGKPTLQKPGVPLYVWKSEAQKVILQPKGSSLTYVVDVYLK